MRRLPKRRRRGPRRWLLLAAYALQALGIVLGLLWPTPAGFALSSALVGLPFTAITFYGLQEARRLWPQSADSFASLVTAVYGLGQIAGPPLVAWLLAHADAGQGLARGLALAAGAAPSAARAGKTWRPPTFERSSASGTSTPLGGRTY